MKMIPVNEPVLDGKEKEFLIQCIETGWISAEGPFERQFEERFASVVARRYGIAVCNGTAALDVAVAALGIGAGDEVIMPTFTIISCAAAIVRAGATPVLVDCDPVTWNMDPGQIQSRITQRTKAVLVVHIYGLPVDMDRVLEICSRHGLKIIEDAAEMHGQAYRGRPCGSFGEISTFSFYSNKHITTGEGGMLVTDDEKLAKRCRSLRNLCFGERRFIHEELGYNYRMTHLQAALGVAQLERLDAIVRKKRHIGKRYTKLFRDVEGIHLPLSATEYAENIYWVYGMVLRDGAKLNADGIMSLLAKRGIGTRPFFWCMHEQPVFGRMGLFAGEKYPAAERIARMGFYIPSGLALTDGQIETVAAEVKAVIKEAF